MASIGKNNDDPIINPQAQSLIKYKNINIDTLKITRPKIGYFIAKKISKADKPKEY